MNGATEDPSPITSKKPTENKNIITGRSQYFFLNLINSQNSLIKPI